MRNLSFILAFLAVSSAANVEAQTTTTQSQSVSDFYRYVGPDIDLQVGGGYQWNTFNAIHNTTIGMSRLRMGVMWVPKYPWTFSVGPTLELNSSTTPVWGAQVEVLNFGAGLWLRVGGGMDYQAHPHYNAALGWSVFGVEVNGFSAGPYDNQMGVAILGTARIPLGFIIYTFTKLH